MNPLKPTEKQEEIIRMFTNAKTRGGILGLGTGVGKTLVSAEIIRRRGGQRVIIMAPESTFDSWASTIYWQTGKKIRRCASNALTFDFTPNPNNRQDKHRVKLSAALCKENLEACMGGEDGIFFVTRELFTSKTWRKVPVKKGGQEVIDPKTGKPRMRSMRKDVWGEKKAFDIAVLDENQPFAKRGNRGQKSWQYLNANFKIASSADWHGGHVENMHCVAVDIFGKEEIGINYAEFEDQYLKTRFSPFAYTKTEVVGEKIPGFFASSLPLYVTTPPSVEPPEPEVRHIDLSRAERELYDQLENNYVARVGDKILTAEIPLTLRIRLRELSLGTFRVVDTGEVDEEGIPKQTIEFDEDMKSAKLDEIKSILRDHPGEKFCIFTHSAKWARRAAQMLGGEAWTGSESKTRRAEIKRDFIEGDLRVIVAHPATMGTGTDGLQAACHNVIFASKVDRHIDNHQAVSRFARTGQEHPVSVWELSARDTFDDDQIERLTAKTRTADGAKGW